MKKQYELLQDPRFARGFRVLNMGGEQKGDPKTGIFPCGESDGEPAWAVAQWESRWDFRDPAQTVSTQPEPGVFSWDSRDKVFTVDTNTNTLGMELNAGLVYDAPRVVNQGWPHLLVENATVRQPLKELSAMRLSWEQRLTMFRDHMGTAADPLLHAGSFYIYLYIKGINDRGLEEMLWFGLTLFDNRFDFEEEKGSEDTGKADATGLFIYQVPTRAYRRVPVGSHWLSAEVDVLPYVRRALELAGQRGYMRGISWESMYLDGMNMGWEMPGTYDGKMEIRNLSLKGQED